MQTFERISIPSWCASISWMYMSPKSYLFACFIRPDHVSLLNAETGLCPSCRIPFWHTRERTRLFYRYQNQIWTCGCCLCFTVSTAHGAVPEACYPSLLPQRELLPSDSSALIEASSLLRFLSGMASTPATVVRLVFGRGHTCPPPSRFGVGFTPPSD